MFWLYILAIIPISIGISLKIFFHKKITWLEYIIGSLIALVTAGVFHIWAYNSQIGDQETWSGSIVEARQFSAWKEWYEEAIYRTEYYTSTESYYSNGKTKYRTVTKSRRVFSHWEPRTRWHEEYWKMYSNIDTEYQITKEYYLELSKLLGGDFPVAGKRQTCERNSKMIGGDSNDWVAVNKTGYIEPVNKSVYFENRIKNSNSIFRKRKISENEKKNLYEYPYSKDPFTSERLLGEENKYILKIDWERLNAYLGPIKYINLICIGYPDGTSPDIFEKQIAYWNGGKKNDFIIGFSKGWSKTYSWSDDKTAEKNVETIFLNPESKTLLKDLEKEILKNYKIVNWEEKFKYISVEPQTKHVVWYIVCLFLTQGVLYFIFHRFDFSKNY